MVARKTGRTLAIRLLFLLLIFGCSRFVVIKEYTPNSYNWPQYGRNPARTHYSPHNLQLPMQLLWDRRASSTIGPTIVAANGNVLYGTFDGRIEAIDIKTGKRVGKIKTQRDTESTCALWRNALIVIKRIGPYSLSLVDLSSGKTVWRENIGTILTEPLITDDAVYVATLSGILYKFDALNGAKEWSFESGAQIHSSPAFAEGTIVFGNDSGEIYAINAIDGTKEWEYSTGSAVIATAMISSNTVFIGSTNNRFYALRLLDGKELWHFETGGKLYNGAAAVDSLLLFGSTDHFLYCVEAGSGQLIWKFDAASVIGTSPVVANDVVFFGSLDHILYAVNILTGKELWSFELEGRIRTTPVVVDGFLLAASENDFFYCFGVESE
jgi:outer membrane protein assembly factor BamB